MDIEQRKRDFQAHHKHPVNILFHIVCGILYISLFFTLFPQPVYYIYALVVCILFPSIPVTIVIALMIPLLRYLGSYKLSPIYTLCGINIAYFLPELSHYMTREDTVLKINTVTTVDIIDNFFFLLPHSILASTKASY